MLESLESLSHQEYTAHTHTHTCGDEAEGLKKEKHHKKKTKQTPIAVLPYARLNSECHALLGNGQIKDGPSNSSPVFMSNYRSLE